MQLTSRAEGVLHAPCMSPAKRAVSIGAGWLARHGGIPGVCRWEASAEASPLLVDSHRYFYKVFGIFRSEMEVSDDSTSGGHAGHRHSSLAGSTISHGYLSVPNTPVSYTHLTLPTKA